MNVIEGVTVLNEIVIYKDVPVLLLLLTIIALVGGVLTIAIGLVGLDFGDSIGFFVKIIIGIMLIVLGIIGAIYTDKITKQPTGDYEYQVTIDDTVVMSEFYENYEVIEVQGKIYTIKEKDGE